MSTKAFTPISEASKAKPPMQSTRNRLMNGDFKTNLTLAKDLFSAPAWLEFGAALFIPVYFVLHPIIGVWVVFTPLILIAWRLADVILRARGTLPNTYMDEVVPFKVAAQMPNDDGSYGPEAAKDGVCVFMIGAKNNHLLGILAPGFKEMGDYFLSMNKDVEANADKYGLLGTSSWIEWGARESQNTIMTVQYYKDSAGLNKFAHDDMHMKGWNWFNKHSKQYPHLAIYHEVFEAPAGSWEGIYVNSKPMLMGANAYPIKNEQGENSWYPGLVDARKGLLASMKGRMSRYGDSYS